MKTKKAAKAPSKRGNSSGHRARKKNVGKAKTVGRPSEFNEVIFGKICDLLSKGKPLTTICGNKKMPCDDTVRNWAEADETVATRLRAARQRGFDALAVQTIAIADDKSRDVVSGEFGDKPNVAAVMRAKLQVETRLKLLSKWDPDRYGDRVKTEVSGPGGKPVEIHQTGEFVMTPEQEQRLVDAARLRATLTPPACMPGAAQNKGEETEDE